MIKIFLTVRNRLAITKKCIHALKEHSTIAHQIYVYDNQTNYMLDAHFHYFQKLYSKRYIAQITFGTNESNFNAFSKAASCNFFGLQHEQDPKKDSYNFLVMLDNDIIVTPGWDKKLHTAWKHVAQHKMQNVKVIGQLPGGIKRPTERVTIEGMNCKIGKLGGSGLWSVRPNFFRDVGFLNLSQLVGHDKKHDQLYWGLMDRSTRGQPYIMGLDQKLGIHCGSMAGSICNKLTRLKGDKNKLDKIKFVDSEEIISSMDFKTFFDKIYNDKKLINDW